MSGFWERYQRLIWIIIWLFHKCLIKFRHYHTYHYFTYHILTTTVVVQPSPTRPVCDLRLTIVASAVSWETIRPSLAASGTPDIWISELCNLKDTGIVWLVGNTRPNLNWGPGEKITIWSRLMVLEIAVLSGDVFWALQDHSDLGSLSQVGHPSGQTL